MVIVALCITGLEQNIGPICFHFHQLPYVAHGFIIVGSSRIKNDAHNTRLVLNWSPVTKWEVETEVKLII